MSVSNVGIEAKIKLLKGVADAIEDSPVEDNLLNRTLLAGVTGGTTFGLSRAFGQKMPTSVALGIAGLVSGYGVLPLAHMIRNNQKTSIIKKQMHKMHDASRDVFDNASAPINELFAKRAGLGWNTVRGVGKLLGGAAIFGGRQIWKGLKPAAKAVLPSGKTYMPPHRLVRGAVVKGTALVGGMTATSATIGKITNPTVESGANYTTYLRNNVLAGRINPNQLGADDLADIKRLGMR